MTALLLPLLVPLAHALTAPEPPADLVEVHVGATSPGVRLVCRPPADAGPDARPYVIELRVQPWPGAAAEPPALSLSAEPVAVPPLVLSATEATLASVAPPTAAMATQPLDQIPATESAFLRHAEAPPAEEAAPPAPDAALAAVREPPPERLAAAASYELACEGGHARACADLADLVGDGRLGSADPARAASLRERACAAGDAASCDALRPPAPPVGEAGPTLADALQEGCDQGDIAACADLGTRAAQGDGVPQDYARAARLFQHACANGDRGACTDLGILYAVGEGVSKDEIRAQRLFQLACDDGTGDDRACGLLER